ncbi:MAG: hypothetical protein J2P54_11330 [Bradyrhizobiaceae bacterium]|nr:hypothetical protein [Bradyrhizobiaceae bacterium]
MRWLDRWAPRYQGQDRTETVGTMAATYEAAQRGTYAERFLTPARNALSPEQIKHAETRAAPPLLECAS